jgi:hypothetical protein
MSLDQLYQEIDKLNPDELQQIQKYIEQRRREASEARADSLMQAFDKLREALTEQQLEDMERAMNSKYSEPPDASWKE